MRSINEHCIKYNYSRATYFKNRKKGLGPKELRLPGSSIVRITDEAERDWLAHLEILNAAENSPIREERAARVEQASKAGKKGAASPAHHCRRTRVR